METVSTVQHKIGLLMMFIFLGWLGFEPHFERLLHDFQHLPAATSQITPIIDQAAWYALFGDALARAFGPGFLAIGAGRETPVLTSCHGGWRRMAT